MIISISGFPGSGKSTVAEILSEKLKMPRYYMGGIRRETARKMGMTIEQFNEMGKTDPSTDKVVDDYLVELAEKDDNFIVESRTAFYFIPNSLKVYLDVELNEAAKRIYKECSIDDTKRNEIKYNCLEDVTDEVKTRVESDSIRYRKYYDIDCYDKSNYDLVIDTTKLNIDEVVAKITDYIKDKEHINTK